LTDNVVDVQSNFLHGFSSLSPHKTKKSKLIASQLDGLWLALFVNLSFSTEGQTMILKIDGRRLVTRYPPRDRQ